MLATITGAPLQPRARREQPTQYVKAPYTQHVKAKKDGETRADQLRRHNMSWNTLQQRCRDGEILLRKQPQDSEQHLR
eukprot:9494000-Pyramimonas_sp.AAC.1